MKPKVLRELQRFNSTAKEHSWELFQLLLRELLSTTLTPESKILLDHLEKGDWDELVNEAERIASTEYPTPALHRLNVQLSSVIRKYPFPDGLVTFDPRVRALRTFYASERKCSLVNRRFMLFDTLRSPHEELLQKARSWIHYVLGDLSLSDVWRNCDFGAGASLGIHGNATNSARKLLSPRWTVTPGAYHYAMAALKTDPLVMELLNGEPNRVVFSVDPDLFNNRFGEKAHIVDYNKVAFVPKTVKTHRAIAVEPLLNGFLQKGTDLLMRKRLKRVGIDLEDQTLNQRLAREGSLRWTEPDAFCTIDLSSASDSLSIGLCRSLLPPEWFAFLDAIRSHAYLIDGKKNTYHKFASMGNGFCFPLESLIFASLCKAVDSSASVGRDFCVYGDDIVVRKRMFSPLVCLLKVCGFKVNTEKTFSEGPFRESCGSDWFEGEDVRPIMLDYRLDSLQNMFKLCNIISSKDTWKGIFYGFAPLIRERIPPLLRFMRPQKGNPDTALEVAFDEFLASPYSKYSLKTMSWSWVELVTSATPDKGVRHLARYNVALMRGALAGVTSSSPFTERYTSRTKVRVVCPSSGWSITLPGFLPESFWAIRIGQRSLYR